MDIGFGLHGDIEVSEKGDTRLTYDAIENLVQAVVKRLQNRSRDWRIPYPPECVNLMDLGGSDNSRSTGWKLEKSIRDALTSDSLIPSTMLNIRVFPMSHDTIGALISIDAMNKRAAAKIHLSVDLPSGIIRIGVTR